MAKERLTGRGAPIERPGAGAPTAETLEDGQLADHWVLSDEDRAKGFVRPVRRAYKHVGPPPPANPLRPLTAEEEERYAGRDYAGFEKFPEDHALVGRFWTRAELGRIGGCGTVTYMPPKIAETYAAKPDFYGSTWCCGCSAYLPVGERGEFVWDGTSERVGT